MTTVGDRIRVVVADDQVLLRRTLGMLIDAEPDLELAGEAATGAEAVEVAGAVRPDVVLMDIRIPELDGLEATRRICDDASLADVRIVVLTMFELDEYVYRALQSGASGFLLKDAPPERLPDAIRRVHAGETLLAPRVLAALVDRYLAAGAPTVRVENDGPGRLTPRELEVLALIGRGRSNAEIEAALHISRGTLKSHVSHLLTKLQARDRAQLVIAAYRRGLVHPDR